MIDLKGWDLASSIRLEYLNRLLTKRVTGKVFRALQPGAQIGGAFAAWELSVDDGATTLTVTVADGSQVNWGGTESQDIGGMRVAFPVDFNYMARTPVSPRDLIHLDFSKAKGIGKPGSIRSFKVWRDRGKGTAQTIGSPAKQETQEQTIGTLLIDAILDEPTLATTPVAVLMHAGSIQASWYKPTRVDFAVTTRDDGHSYVSILVSAQKKLPDNLPTQPPAELHSGYVNMAFARGFFWTHVIVPSLERHLTPLGNSKRTRDTGSCSYSHEAQSLAEWRYPDFLSPVGIATVQPTDLTAITCSLTKVTARWVDATIETNISGKCAYEVADVGLSDAAWYTFSGNATHELRLDPASQRLTLHCTRSQAVNLSSKGLAAVSSSLAPSSEPSLDSSWLAAHLCAISEFAPVRDFAFQWAGIADPRYRTADFGNDVVLHSASDATN